MHYRGVIGLLTICLAAPVLLAQQDPPAQRFLIEVTSLVPNAERTVRGAIGYDGQLELLEASTPFTKELDAVAITALFAVVEPEGNVQVVLYGNSTAPLTKHGGASGRAIKIVEDPRDRLVPLSFGSF